MSFADMQAELDNHYSAYRRSSLSAALIFSRIVYDMYYAYHTVYDSFKSNALETEVKERVLEYLSRLYEVLEIDMLMRDVEFGLPNATVMNSEPNSFGGLPELNMVAISLENADEYWCIHVPEQLLDRYFCDELADNTVNWMVEWYNALVSAYIHNTLNTTNHRIVE